jgi:hypothetical protein
MVNLIDGQRNRALKELHAAALEAVAAWDDPYFDQITEDSRNKPEVDRMMWAMFALDRLLRGLPAPPKWVPEPCLDE